MKRLVAQTSLYYFELSENWIHTQVKYLKGWDSLVLTNETKNMDTVNRRPRIYERRERLPIGIRELDSIAMKLIGYYPSFYWQVKKAKAQLVHAHFGPMGFLSLGIARRLDIPLVTTFYGYDASELPRDNPYWQENYQMLFKGGSQFLVEGPAMGDKLVRLGCPPEKITIQRLGIERAEYSTPGSYDDGRKVRILMVGRFVEKKGFIFGLRAFYRFLENGERGTLTIIGDHNGTNSSRRIKQELVDFVAEQGLEEVVDFKGLVPLDKLKKEYYKHDVFLAPSIEAENGDDEGGLPVTVIEAAAAGTALVGSRHCDIPEVIQPEKTGLLAEEKDVKKLADHLVVLAENPQKRETFGQQAAKLISNEYDASKQGQKLSAIYNKLL